AIASNPSDESQVRRHKGWMGQPLGPRVRVYDDATFAPGNSLVANGTFDADITGWSGNNVTVSRVTTGALTGSGALMASTHINYDPSMSSTTITGPLLSLTAGQEYTLAFAVRASPGTSEEREIRATVGSHSQRFLASTDWLRRVMTFRATTSGNHRISFAVGRENTQVWIDDVYLFRGNANVFYRVFEHAVVVVNATPSSRTGALGGTFRRILGTGQDPINDGSSLTSITVAPYDAAILVRP
ncbi:MAG: hypothetical protein MN733_13335, partial [Nitrososphaera sp.]|nr:hypothetical protein [Nitrososphaera sp.]